MERTVITERSQIPNNDPEWDQLSIETPELVALDMPIAGLGSRFVALMVDYLIWLAVLILFILVIALVDPSLSHFSKIGQKWEMAIFTLVPFLFLWGYFTLFEAFWNGRTPGKRVAKIRVIQISGRGIGLFESMTRNLVRFVDQIPGIYAVGAVSIFLTRQHQRLGDMAAGTLVVHEREHLAESISDTISTNRIFNAGFYPANPYPASPASSVSATPSVSSFPAVNLQNLGPQDLEVLEGFFARRLDFSLETRATLAARIAFAIAFKAHLPPPDPSHSETFLEEIARPLRDFSRLR